MVAANRWGENMEEIFVNPLVAQPENRK